MNCLHASSGAGTRKKLLNRNLVYISLPNLWQDVLNKTWAKERWCIDVNYMQDNGFKFKILSVRLKRDHMLNLYHVAKRKSVPLWGRVQIACQNMFNNGPKWQIYWMKACTDLSHYVQPLSRHGLFVHWHFHQYLDGQGPSPGSSELFSCRKVCFVLSQRFVACGSFHNAKKSLSLLFLLCPAICTVLLHWWTQCKIKGIHFQEPLSKLFR